MVTKIKFQPNCYNFLKYRAVYTVVVVICAIIPIIFLIDPIALPSQIDQTNTKLCSKQDLKFSINVSSAKEVDVKGPMGITKIPSTAAVAKPYRQACKVVGSSQAIRNVTALIFKDIKVIKPESESTNSSQQKLYFQLKIEPDENKSVYPSYKDEVFRAYAVETIDTLTSQQSIASALLAVIVVAAVVIIVFIWFSCEGWCDCESPWKSAEQTVGGDMFV